MDSCVSELIGSNVSSISTSSIFIPNYFSLLGQCESIPAPQAVEGLLDFLALARCGIFLVKVLLQMVSKLFGIWPESAIFVGWDFHVFLAQTTQMLTNIKASEN